MCPFVCFFHFPTLIVSRERLVERLVQIHLICWGAQCSPSESLLENSKLMAASTTTVTNCVPLTTSELYANIEENIAKNVLTVNRPAILAFYQNWIPSKRGKCITSLNCTSTAEALWFHRATYKRCPLKMPILLPSQDALTHFLNVHTVELILSARFNSKKQISSFSKKEVITR